MGTRAVYSFSDDRETFHVYKHWDGYPENALQYISFAKDRAWKLHDTRQMSLLLVS